MASLWAAIYARTRDDGIGVKLAKALPRGSFRAVEYLVRTSSTLAAGLERLVRFQRLLRSDEVLAVGDEPAPRVSYTLDYDVALGGERSWAEYGLAAFLQVARTASGMHWSPVAIHLEHSAPVDVSAHAFFGCPVLFERPSTEILLDNETLHARLPEADPALCSVIEDAATRQLLALPASDDACMLTRKAIFGSFPGDEPELEQVAERVGMSARALQRRLQEDETSFRLILDEVRLGLAKQYLVNDQLSLLDVAALLGYSDASAFHRAFKRWTGVAPGRFRKQAG